MAERTLTLDKAPNSKVGVRLQDGKTGKVKVSEVDPNSPLAAFLTKGDAIISVNGELCNQGHKAAADLLRNAEGSVTLVVRARKQSNVGKLLRRSSSTVAAPPSEAIVIPGTPGSAAAETAVAEAVEVTPEEAKSGGAVTPIVTVEPAVSVVFNEVPTPPSESELEPTGAAEAAVEAEAAPVPSPYLDVPLGPDEYLVVLKKQKGSSIGMRLVQKRYDDLPTIADIDKVRARLWRHARHEPPATVASCLLCAAFREPFRTPTAIATTPRRMGRPPTPISPSTTSSSP